jgi:hypothetical protein
VFSVTSLPKPGPLRRLSITAPYSRLQHLTHGPCSLSPIQPINLVAGHSHAIVLPLDCSSSRAVNTPQLEYLLDPKQVLKGTIASLLPYLPMWPILVPC